jgi:predicted DsbA family dithiol-disulfide isomerase
MRPSLVIAGLMLTLAACSKDGAPEPTAAIPDANANANANANTNANTNAADTPPAIPPFDAGAVLPLFADAGFNAREQSDFASILAGIDAPCPSVPVSIAQCIAEHRACPDCLSAARYVALGIRDGWPGQYIGAGLAGRFDPEQIKDLPDDGSPSKGPASAPLTIVEFGSYLCPHCAAEAPKLEAVLAAHPKQIRLVFKPVWAPDNQTSMHATRAAFAAGAQGKFWEMHALIFGNQPRAADADLDGYAQSLGLDMTRFHADVKSPETSDRMKRDMAMSGKAGVDTIPALFINGHALMPFEKLEERIAFEIGQLPATGKSPSAPH